MPSHQQYGCESGWEIKILTILSNKVGLVRQTEQVALNILHASYFGDLTPATAALNLSKETLHDVKPMARTLHKNLAMVNSQYPKSIFK
jgi:hypothetical protein